MSLITDTILNFLPSKRKKTPSGWISFDAVCCDDQRQRGGLIFNAGDAVSYHCFNCGFKASWQPGRALSQKMRKFMRDLNMPDDVINKLGIEALRLSDSGSDQTIDIIPKFNARELPPGSRSFDEWATFLKLTDDGYSIPDGLHYAVKYITDRGLGIHDYPFYWTKQLGFSNRIIVPFYKDGIVVGYTARAVGDAKPKYISEQQPGYVFNLDCQTHDRTFVIVSEGPFDAISIDGCALLGSEIKDSQNWLLKQLHREIILVPDRDEAGEKTVEQAIEFGWSVSMPEWPENVKDINDAVKKLGRLATLWLIINSKEKNALKIRLHAKQWFKQYETNI